MPSRCPDSVLYSVVSPHLYALWIPFVYAQYRYGGTLPEVLKTLWAEGGIPRFYRGLSFALVQVRGKGTWVGSTGRASLLCQAGARLTMWLAGGCVQTPLARFGDTASNALVLVLLDTMDVTRDLPLPLKTGGPLENRLRHSHMSV